MKDAPVLVSACLAGESCRYDGTAAPNPEVLRLVTAGRAVAVCPERLGGMPVPREPAERLAGRVVCRSGRDVTREFLAGAQEALKLAQKLGCERAILKARSPSCGCGRIYDGTFARRLAPGDGVFAELLKKSGIAAESDEDF